MNCKPGDLAFIKANSRFVKEPTAMMVVEVIRLAPIGDFLFPNGSEAHNANPDSWVVKFSRPITVLVMDKQTWVKNEYGSVPDGYLHPIRDPGDDAADESHAWLPPVPSRETA